VSERHRGAPRERHGRHTPGDTLYWLEDAHGQITRVGRRLARVTGLSTHALRGVHRDALVFEDDAPSLERAAETARRTKRSVVLDVRLARTARQPDDGTDCCWVRAEVQAFEHEPGYKWRLTDIHDLKVLEERSYRLQTAATAFAQHLSTSAIVKVFLHEGVWAVRAHSAAVVLLTHEPPGLRVAGTYRFTPEPDPDELSPNVAGAVQDALRAQQPLFFHTHDAFLEHYGPGDDAPQHATRSLAILPFIVDDAPLGAAIFNFDHPRAFPPDEQAFLRTIASECAQALARAKLHEDEQSARRELERTRALLDTLLDRAPIGFALLDGNLRYLKVNPVLANLNGLPIHEHLGRTPLELFPGMPRMVVDAARQVLSTNRPILNLATTGQSPGEPGRERHWITSFYPVHAPDNVWLGVGVLVQDVTDRVLAERELRALNEDLEARVEERTKRWQDLHTELTAHAAATSSNVLEPLRRIRATLDLVRRRHEGLFDEKTTYYLSLIHEEAARASRIVEDLKLLRSLEGRELNTENVPLFQVVVQVRSDLEPFLKGRRVRWTVHDLPTVRGDALLLREAFTALIAQFLDTVPVDVTCAITVSGVTYATEYVIEMHGQCGAYGRDGPASPGLPSDWAQVRRIVNRHGGRVWVEAESGQGVTFFMALPRTPDTQSSAS